MSGIVFNGPTVVRGPVSGRDQVIVVDGKRVIVTCPSCGGKNGQHTKKDCADR